MNGKNDEQNILMVYLLAVPVRPLPLGVVDFSQRLPLQYHCIRTHLSECTCQQHTIVLQLNNLYN